MDDQVKQENDEDFAKQCMAASVANQLFGDEIAMGGLIQIDSSSGSDSTSDSSESDSSSDEHFTSAIVQPAYTEHVPPGNDYVVRKKSKIMHSAQVGSNLTKCKTQTNSNFNLLPRVFRFRHPRCVKCFPRNHNRLATREQVVEFLDKAAAKRKAEDDRA